MQGSHRLSGLAAPGRIEPEAEPTATLRSMSMKVTCNQSLSEATYSIIHIAQKAMATQTRASSPTSAALAAMVGAVDVGL